MRLTRQGGQVTLVVLDADVVVRDPVVTVEVSEVVILAVQKPQVESHHPA
jgi:hypothetical protein